MKTWSLPAIRTILKERLLLFVPSRLRPADPVSADEVHADAPASSRDRSGFSLPGGLRILFVGGYCEHRVDRALGDYLADKPLQLVYDMASADLQEEIRKRTWHVFYDELHLPHHALNPSVLVLSSLRSRFTVDVDGRSMDVFREHLLSHGCVVCGLVATDVHDMRLQVAGLFKGWTILLTSELSQVGFIFDGEDRSEELRQRFRMLNGDALI